MDRNNKIEMLFRLVELIPKLNIQEGGPALATIANEIADELDMPAIKLAVQKEIELAAQRKKQLAEQAQEQAQMQAAQLGLDKQLEAEKIQSKNTGDMIKFATTVVNAKGGDNGKTKEPSN